MNLRGKSLAILYPVKRVQKRSKTSTPRSKLATKVNKSPNFLASHAGVLRGAPQLWEGRDTSSPRNACVGGYQLPSWPVYVTVVNPPPPTGWSLLLVRKQVTARQAIRPCCRECNPHCHNRPELLLTIRKSKLKFNTNFNF